jgi:hypothetical protein
MEDGFGLKDLTELRDSGVLTPDEYDAAKGQGSGVTPCAGSLLQRQ